MKSFLLPIIPFKTKDLSNILFLFILFPVSILANEKKGYYDFGELYLTYYFNNQDFTAINQQKSSDSLAFYLLESQFILQSTFENPDSVQQFKDTFIKVSRLFVNLGAKQMGIDQFKKIFGHCLQNTATDTSLLFESSRQLKFLAELDDNQSVRYETLTKSLAFAEKAGDHKRSSGLLSELIRYYLDSQLFEKAKLYQHSFIASLGEGQDLSDGICLTMWKYNQIVNGMQSDQRFEDQLTLSDDPMTQIAFMLTRMQIGFSSSIPLERIKQIAVGLDSKSNVIEYCAVNQALFYYLKERDSVATKYLLEAHQALQNQVKWQESQLFLIENRLSDPVFINNSLALIKTNSSSINWLGLPFWIFLFVTMLIVFWKISKQHKQKVQFQKDVSKASKQRFLLTETLNSDENVLDDLVKKREIDLKNELELSKKMDHELSQALRKAEEANFHKNAFLANMSHEIRTPLNGILNFSNLLEVELAMLEQPYLYEYANSIQKSGEKLLHLLNNIIDISRLEANDMELKLIQCNLSTICIGLIDEYQPSAKLKGLNIISDLKEVPFIKVDQTILKRVISEVLDNAVKYTEKGYIKLSLSYDKNSKRIEIAVTDTGIGIDQTYLPMIFEAFRHDSLGYTRQSQGAGLGLPLAKRLADMMESELIVTSEKSVGTTIRLNFVNKEDILLQPIEKPVIEESPENINLTGLNILVVEDDSSNMLVISKLIGNDLIISPCSNGEEALAALAKADKSGLKFDLMLFDINLPSPWDGLKLRQYILKNYPYYQNIPFVAQTAYAMSGDKDRFLEAGFNGYIPKPIRKDLLISTLKKALTH